MTWSGMWDLVLLAGTSSAMLSSLPLKKPYWGPQSVICYVPGRLPPCALLRGISKDPTPTPIHVLLKGESMLCVKYSRSSTLKSHRISINQFRKKKIISVEMPSPFILKQLFFFFLFLDHHWEAQNECSRNDEWSSRYVRWWRYDNVWGLGESSW